MATLEHLCKTSADMVASQLLWRLQIGILLFGFFSVSLTYLVMLGHMGIALSVTFLSSIHWCPHNSHEKVSDSVRLLNSSLLPGASSNMLWYDLSTLSILHLVFCTSFQKVPCTTWSLHDPTSIWAAQSSISFLSSAMLSYSFNLTLGPTIEICTFFFISRSLVSSSNFFLRSSASVCPRKVDVRHLHAFHLPWNTLQWSPFAPVEVLSWVIHQKKQQSLPLLAVLPRVVLKVWITSKGIYVRWLCASTFHF